MGTIGSKPRRHGVLNNERGFALFGVFLTILMMTALGIAAMTMTGLENRMAGSANSTDAAAAAAESCIGTGVNVIMQTLQERQVPPSYLVGPAAVIPANAEGAIAPTLTQEIMGQANNNADVGWCVSRYSDDRRALCSRWRHRSPLLQEQGRWIATVRGWV